jgi:CelD/BcsL family acetyltransferase involved in cellulose biosynthesis
VHPVGLGTGGGMSWQLFPASEFARHAAAWRGLHLRGPASPVLDQDMVRTLLATFGDGREMLAVHGSPSQPDAMAVVAPAGRAGWQTFQPAQAPAALWLALPGADTRALAAGLLRRLPGLVLGVTQLDPLLTPRCGSDAFTSTLDYIDTAWIDTACGFDSYWEERGKNLRTNLKKQRNRLERDGIAARLTVLTQAEQMAQAVAEYGQLESSGWKAGDGTAVSAGNAQGAFYRQLLEAFALRGQARVFRYSFDGRVVAMDLCIEGGSTIVILKTAYDEAVGSQFSPALLMREEAFRLLFAERHLARIEFYGRVMEWHRRWTSQSRTMYHLNVYRWPFLKRLHHMVNPRPQQVAATTE